MKKLLKMITVMSLLIVVAFVTNGNKSQAMTVRYGTVTSDFLNVRSGPGTSYSIIKSGTTEVKLKKGNQVKITEVYSGWYKVSFSYSGKTLTGYVSGQYLTVKLVEEKVYHPINVAATINKQYKTGSIKLKKNLAVKVIGEKTVKKVKYYRVKFTYKKKVYRKYIPASYIKFTLKKTAAAQIVCRTKIKPRKTAGTTGAYVKLSGKAVYLKNAINVTIIKERRVKGKRWLRVSFTYKNKTLKGYVLDSYVKLVKVEDAGITPGTVLTAAQFEQEMTKQGFPESYKPQLRILHNLYPKWQFQAYQTGLDWTTATNNESKDGLCTLPISKSPEWKSYEGNNYDWTTDSFHIYDGTTWVSASRKAIKYYMDPRNFLDARGVFQYELLTYQSSYQTKAGVANILKNTPFNTDFYADTFIAAAQKSGVSPYHLASRSKQEVVLSSTKTTIAVTGNVSGYNSIFNYYNIGASDGVNPVMRGLAFAATTNEKFLLPWNTKYRAIVGGGLYIGNNFINRGQNTCYLQKFNVTPTSTYWHQYMSNVEAANAEATKVYTGYADTMSELPIVFSIPVYANMPAEACEAPSGGKNPNNYLKTLTVSGYTLAPQFSIADAGATTYTLTVPTSTTSVTIGATTVSSLAKVAGTGTKTLSGTTTTAVVTATAESGSKRTYTIKIVKGN